MPTILCIDDHTYGLASAIEVLRSKGYDVIAAADRSEALDVVVGNSVDVVCLNCHSDACDAEFIATLRSINSFLAIVMMSAFCGVSCQQLRMADACIQKGDTAMALLSAIELVLCQRRFGLCRAVSA